jgi:hypothetical protein
MDLVKVSVHYAPHLLDKGLNINKISDQGIYSLGFGTFETFKIL